jgi:hypothetical protein
MIQCLPVASGLRDDVSVSQMELFSRAQLAAMRDRTRRRNYSAEAEQFRRDHQRHRAWGLQQRQDRKLSLAYGSTAAAWAEFQRRAGEATSPSTPARPTRPIPTGPVPSEATQPEQNQPEHAVHEPVGAESVTAESVTAEPVTAESVGVEPVTAESVTAESVTAESVTAEPVGVEPVGVEPVRDAAGGSDPGNPSRSVHAGSRAGCRRIRSGQSGRRHPGQRGKHRGPAPGRMLRSAPHTPRKGTKPPEHHARRQPETAERRDGTDAYPRQVKRLSTHRCRTASLRTKGFRENAPP